MIWDPEFAAYVCNQLPVGLLDELARAYYERPLAELLTEEEEGLKQALGVWNGEKLT